MYAQEGRGENINQKYHEGPKLDKVYKVITNKRGVGFYF